MIISPDGRYQIFYDDSGKPESASRTVDGVTVWIRDNDVFNNSELAQNFLTSGVDLSEKAELRTNLPSILLGYD